MKSRHPPTCLNCGEPVVGDYCWNCGQRHRDVHRPISSFFRDFWDVVFSIESKLWRSVLYLIFAPGVMTRDFNAGKRARYVHPLRIYLLATLLFFLIAGINNIALMSFEVRQLTPEQAQAKYEEKKQVLEGLVANPDIPVAAKRQLREDLENLSVERSGTDIVTVWFRPLPETGLDPSLLPELGLSGNMQEELQADADLTPSQAQTIGRYLNNLFEGFAIALENPRRFNQQLFVWWPRAMIIVLPLFAILLRMHYWGRTQRLLNQLVFSLHFHAFLFVLMTIAAGVVALWGPISWGWAFLLPVPVYLWTALKISTAGGILRTSVKFVSLSVLYCTTLATTMALATGIGIAEL